MNLKPVGNNIVLKPLDSEKTTASGIIIPDTVDKERPEKGEVLAVGPGKVLDSGQRQPIEVQVGNKVIFKKYAPDEFEIDGQKYLIISSDDVMAVIE
ncbi:MAG: co-chaperone GroES [Patescibacteria group bacterium]